ncbi:MAG TPA: hypothetical protein VGB17_08875, partial [Pyrinomonadaceae bacterium]
MSSHPTEVKPSRPGHQWTNKFYRIGFATAGVYLLTPILYLKGPQAYTRTGRELLAWFWVLSLLFLFWKGYQALNQSADVLRPKTVICFAAFFCLAAFLTVPFHST